MTANDNVILPGTANTVETIDETGGIGPTAIQRQVMTIGSIGNANTEHQISQGHIPTKLVPESTDAPHPVFLTGDPDGDFNGFDIFGALLDDAGNVAIGTRVTNWPKQDVLGAQMMSDCPTPIIIKGNNGQSYVIDTIGYQSLQLTGVQVGPSGFSASFTGSNDGITWNGQLYAVNLTQSQIGITSGVQNGTTVSLPCSCRYVRLTFSGAGSGTVIAYLRASNPFVLSATNLMSINGSSPQMLAGGNYTGLAIAGTTNPGVAVTNTSPPVLAGGIDSGKIAHTVLTDTSGRLQVSGSGPATSYQNTPLLGVQEVSQTDGMSQGELFEQIAGSFDSEWIKEGVNILEQVADDASGIGLNTRVMNQPRQDVNGAQMVSDAPAPIRIQGSIGQVFYIDTQGYASIIFGGATGSFSATINGSNEMGNWQIMTGTYAYSGELGIVTSVGTFPVIFPCVYRYIQLKITTAGYVVGYLRSTYNPPILPINLATVGSAIIGGAGDGALPAGGSAKPNTAITSQANGFTGSWNWPVMIGGVDSGTPGVANGVPFARRILTDTSGRVQIGNSSAPATSFENAPPLGVQEVSQTDGQSIGELLQQQAGSFDSEWTKENINILEQVVDDASGLGLNTRVMNWPKQDANGALILSDAKPIFIQGTKGSNYIIDTTGYQSLVLDSNIIGGASIAVNGSNDGLTWTAVSGIQTSGTISPNQPSGYVQTFPCFFKYLQLFFFSAGSLSACLRLGNFNVQWSALTAIGGSGIPFVGLNGVLPVSGTAATGAAPSAAYPNLIAGLDSGTPGVTGSTGTTKGVPLTRTLLMDNQGRTRLAEELPVSSYQQTTPLGIQNTEQYDTLTEPQMLGLILQELRIMNQQMAELPNKLNFSIPSTDDPDDYRNDPTLFLN